MSSEAKQAEITPPSIQTFLVQGVAQLYRWACLRLYSNFAWSYDWVSYLVSGGQWATWRNLALEYVVGDQVLELGYGPGHLLVAGNARGLHMIGVDTSPQMAQMAQQRLMRAGYAPTAALGSGLQLPLAAQSVSSVVATFPAEYILAPATVVEYYRVLRPGGRLIIVGLWIAHRWLELPVFYSRPAPDRLDALLGPLQTVGFQPQWCERTVGNADLGILVATRPA